MLLICFVLIEDIECLSEFIVVCTIEKHVVSHSLPKVYCLKEIFDFTPLSSCLSLWINTTSIRAVRAVFII